MSRAWAPMRGGGVGARVCAGAPRPLENQGNIVRLNEGSYCSFFFFAGGFFGPYGGGHFGLALFPPAKFLPAPINLSIEESIVKNIDFRK